MRRAVAPPVWDHAEKEIAVEQTKLAFQLENKSLVRIALGAEQTRELVLLMAQAIAAVHLGAWRQNRKEAAQEDEDVDDE